MQSPRMTLPALLSVLSAPVVHPRQLVICAVEVASAESEAITQAVAERAKADTTWDKRFVAIHLFVSYIRDRTGRAALSEMERKAPDASAFLLRQALGAAVAQKAAVLLARSSLNQWAQTGVRMFSDVPIRASDTVSRDASFLVRAAELRASLEVLKCCKSMIIDERFASVVCCSPGVYANLGGKGAHAIVERLLSNPLDLFDPACATRAETCFAEEVLLLACLTRQYVTPTAILVARMRGCVDRARVMSAMFQPSYNPLARVASYPPLLPLGESDLAEVMAVRALRDKLIAPRTLQLPFPPHVCAALREAEVQLRCQVAKDWRLDVEVGASARR